MGQADGSSTRDEHCLSRTSPIDHQGLLVGGQQDADAIFWLGDGSVALRPLTTIEEAQLRARPECVDAFAALVSRTSAREGVLTVCQAS